MENSNILNIKRFELHKLEKRVELGIIPTENNGNIVGGTTYLELTYYLDPNLSNSLVTTQHALKVEHFLDSRLDEFDHCLIIPSEVDKDEEIASSYSYIYSHTMRNFWCHEADLDFGEMVAYLIHGYLLSSNNFKDQILQDNVIIARLSVSLGDKKWEFHKDFFKNPIESASHWENEVWKNLKSSNKWKLLAIDNDAPHLWFEEKEVRPLAPIEEPVRKEEVVSGLRGYLPQYVSSRHAAPYIVAYLRPFARQFEMDATMSAATHIIKSIKSSKEVVE